MRILTCALMVALFLPGCAASQYKQQMVDSYEAFNSLQGYALEHISLTPSSHPNAQQAMDSCGLPFAFRRKAIVDNMYGDFQENGGSSILKAYWKMKELDNQLTDCGDSYGVSINAKMVSKSDPVGLKTSVWLDKLYDSHRDYAFARSSLRRNQEIVNDLSMAIGMGLMSGSQAYQPTTYIDPYFRSDGTYVPGHYRTSPNEFCLDNINGCW